MPTVFVTGATGFIGVQVCRTLVEAGYQPVGLTRQPPANAVRIDGVTYATGDVTNAASVVAAFPPDCQRIIHLVGIIAENKRRGQTFECVHIEGTRAVVDAAKAAGLGQSSSARFVFVSAQGADAASPSAYSRTKASAEALVQASGIPYTIFRPSLVLGPSGDFVRQMEQLIRRPPLSPIPLPFIPVPGSGRNRFQPVWVGDLAQALVRSLDIPDSEGATIPIGGRDAVTFDQLLSAFQRRLNVKKPLLHAPMPLMQLAASVLEAILPTPPITRDQLANLQVDNVTDNGLLRERLGVEPLGFEEALDRVYPKQ